MPKRARKSKEEKVPTWNEILPKLQQMSKEDIINCLSKSWDDTTNQTGIRLDIVEHIKQSEKAIAKLWVRWTDLEDKVLRTAVEVHGENFQYISKHIFNGSRTERQCSSRWKKALQPTLKKANRKWTKDEDDIIIRHVSSGNRSWAEIARELEGRTDNQVKQRYMSELDPNLKKGVWSADEMKILIDSQKQFGNKWSEIAKRIPVSLMLLW